VVQGAAASLAVVTGASSGIGFSLAKQMAAHGHDLLLAAEDDELAAAASALRAMGVDVAAARGDLRRSSGVEELASTVARVGRPVDILALNAGIGASGPFHEVPLASHLDLVALNVTSTVHLARLLLPSMVARGAGKVLITSSIAALMPGPYEATYNASKAFLSSFGEALRVELADHGIGVTVLQPGPTDTEFFERAGMEDTKLGQSRKDDPDDVARDAYEALMAGKDHVVAGAAKNKVQAAVAKVLPDKAVAHLHAPMSKPRPPA
jgi:short-subunit dehydrogenase